MVSGCESTGNPYEDSFFFSSVKADNILSGKRFELAQLHNQISMERSRINELKRRLFSTGKTSSELRQQISILEAKASSLHSQTTPTRATDLAGTPTPVEVIRRQSDELGQQISDLEEKL